MESQERDDTNERISHFCKNLYLLKWILERTQKFPKSQRFFVAKRINDIILDFSL